MSDAQRLSHEVAVSSAAKGGFMMQLAPAVIILSLLCAACQNTDANLRRETARVVGSIVPDQVELSEVSRGMTGVDWRAATPKGSYKCSADDMLRRVNCVKSWGLVLPIAGIGNIS
jgi:hypothetical protein